MATGIAYSVSLDGVSGRLVCIEADISPGVPGWALSGLPDPSVAESRDRCRAAMINSGEKWPDLKITVGLYPADLRKVGSHYDLPIGLALLVAQGRLPADTLRSTVAFGELGLDGRLRAVPGVLAAVLAALDNGLERVIVPDANAREARLIDGIEVVGVPSLAACVAALRGETLPDCIPPAPLLTEVARPPAAGGAGEDADLTDVRGQHQARWCVEVAAAGRHHLFLEGPPGAGKTMLAERYSRLLPDLELWQSIEVTKVHSLAGLLARDDPRVTRPPFQAPNHADTVPSVIGGGTRLIKPGAISLAHHGVLFLDEALEFRPTVHDALRQPLESGIISIRRADGAARFPARFQLILAANPCPCGLGYGKGRDCSCTPSKRRQYAERLSGPVRDRIDIVHTVLPVTRAEMRQQVGAAGASRAVAGRVAEARERARARFAGVPLATNAEVPGHEFRARCPLTADVSAPIEDLVAAGRLTQRGADRVCRIAWTVADLGGRQRPTTADVQEALFLRTRGVYGHSSAWQRVA
ncbi:MAG: YifB family Mg chelatase-like AAA ATPase [Nocardioidaceae bacterium]